MKLINLICHKTLFSFANKKKKDKIIPTHDHHSLYKKKDILISDVDE